MSILIIWKRLQRNLQFRSRLLLKTVEAIYVAVESLEIYVVDYASTRL